MQRDFKISLSQEYYSDVVFLSQYDDDLHLVFAVYDKYAKANSLNGLRAEFTGTRADRLGFTFESTVIGNKVTFVIDTTLSGLAGRHKGEIVFYDGTERMGSANVKIIVEPAARPDGTIDADVARAQEIAERVQEIVDTAKDEVEESLTSVKEDLNSACFEPYTIVWTKRTIKANGGYDDEGNGATSPRLTSRYEIQLGAGCKAAIRFYADGAYLGKLNTDDTISTTGGTWKYFTGSFNPGKYLDMFSADAYQICVVPTDSTVISDAQTWGNAHVTPHTSKLIDKKEYESELRAVNHQLIIPCTTQILTGENNEFELSGRLIRIDGTMPQTARNRLSIYNIFDYSSVAPTYAAKPTWYGEPCDAFTVGHKYRFEYMILSGSVDRGSVTEDFYFDLRTVDQTRAGIVSGDEWICTFQPQMIAFCVGQVEFDDCVMYLKIIDMTEMESDDPYKVPSYFETQLATAISKINADINSTKTRGEYGIDYEAFVFVTDTHWAANKKHSPALIKRVLDSTPISMVIHGGDVIQYRNATKEGAIAEIRGFMNAITEIPCYEFYNVYGNHDSNSNSTPPIAVSMGKEEEFSVLYAPFAYKNNVHWIWEDEPVVLSEERIKNDYYFDHPRTRTRFLCIDWNHPYSDARIGWIQSVLARNDGYRVMVVYHGCYKIDTTTDELVEEHVQIMDIIEPYKAKIVALVTGHAHRDAVFDYYEDGSVPIIITDCDTFRADRMDEETTDEQCIDVYVVDYTNSKIELTRIGRGQDRTVNISVT